jgi:phage gp29-like protein
MVTLLDQFGREIQVKKQPEMREIAVTTIRDIWSDYPSSGLTPQRLSAIFREADGGDVYRQAELFEEMEEKDTHLFSQLQTRKNAVLGCDYDVQPYSESAEDKKIAEFVSEVLFGLEGLEDALLDLLDALGKGYSLQEIIWQIDGSQVVIADLKWIHAKKAVFYERGADMWAKRYEAPRIVTETEPVDGEVMSPWKLVYHRYKARSGYDTRAGILRVCAWMYLFKNYSLKDWVVFAEVFGMPLRLGKYDPGATKADKDALVAAIQSLGSDAAGIISKSTEIEFVEVVKNTSENNVYQVLAEFCNKEMSKAILGQTATSEGTPGKLGNEDAQDAVRRDLIKADAEALSKTIRFQVIRPLVGYNFGWDKPLSWFRFLYEPAEDLKALSEVYKNVYAMQFPLTAEHVSERFKIPMPEKGQTVLPGPVGPMGPMAMKQQFQDSTGDSVRVGKRSDPEGNPGGQIVVGKEEDNPSAGDDPDTVDRFSDRLLSEAPVDDLVDPIRKLVNGAKSLQEIRDGIIGLYPDMDIIEFGNTIQRALVAAELAGRFEVQENQNDFI